MIRRKSPAVIHALCVPLWFIAFIMNNSIAADAAAVWSFAVLVYWFWSRLGGVEMVRFVRLGSIFLALIQNAGWIIASFIHHFFIRRPIEYSLAHLMKGGLDVSSYALAVLFITAFCFVLSILGSNRLIRALEVALFERLSLLKNIPAGKFNKLLLVFTGISILLVLAGIMGFRSVAVNGLAEGEVPVWLVLYKSILPGQVLITALLLFKLINKKNERSFLSWITMILSSAALLFIFFTEGRRSLLFAIVGLIYWYIFFSGKKPRLVLIILITTVIYPLFSQGILFFNFLRGENGVANWQTASAFDILPQAWERFQSSENILSDEKKNTLENLATRPLEATPLGLCLQLSSYQKTFTTGENFFNSLVWTIPGPLFPAKKNYPVQENLLYKHFAIGRDKEEDTVDSIYLTAYTEFSWIGILIYSILVTALWFGVIFLCSKWNVNGVILIVIVTIFFKLFFSGIGESSLSEWMTTARSFLFWIIIYRTGTIFYGRTATVRRIYSTP